LRVQNAGGIFVIPMERTTELGFTILVCLVNTSAWAYLMGCLAGERPGKTQASCHLKAFAPWLPLSNPAAVCVYLSEYTRVVPAQACA
jgi:hypothetical protein